jgi:RNA ligase
VAYPFPKFFNLGERPETQEDVLPWGDGYEIFTKEDGWLGVLYRHNGEFKISTRGSFSSPGAIWATEFLNNYHDLSGLPDEVTLVFEIISSVTKIIVDYHGNEFLALIGAFNRKTGKEYSRKQLEEWATYFKFTSSAVVKCHYSNALLDHLKEVSGKNEEGFVIRFHNGLRIKIKAEDYKRRANLLKALTPLGLWKVMESGKIPTEYEKLFEEDYIDEFFEIKNFLESKYDTILREAEIDFSALDFHCLARIGGKYNRKDFAQQIKINRPKHAHIMFAWLDQKQSSISKYIMEKIRPKGNVMEDQNE